MLSADKFLVFSKLLGNAVSVASGMVMANKPDSLRQGKRSSGLHADGKQVGLLICDTDSYAAWPGDDKQAGGFSAAQKH